MRIDKNHWLFNTPIAHRGLWGAEIIENSITAYKNAVENGFAIEIDLYSSTDGVLFSFHDLSLKRMTGAEGNITDFDSNYLNSLKLIGSQEKIPTFREVLHAVNGKVPLLIEIKNQKDELIVERVLDELFEYQGEYAIQSFNPLYINKVKKIAPFVIRGVLGTAKADGEKWFTKVVLKRLCLNFLVKPDFVSYQHVFLPLPKRKTRKKAVLAWTVKSQEIANNLENKCDNIIFEHFIPTKR
jgi:glycerophosphoryl diester phosphodiesterase